jgi:aspartyl-tRNA(Asn)/glutamyl-tRNA(Gln) amidotransferase subunit B
MLTDGKNPADIVKEKGLEQISDTGALEAIIDGVLAQNAQSIQDYQHGKDHALGYLVGQVMKESHGKANPGLAKDLIVRKIGPCVKPNTK